MSDAATNVLPMQPPRGAGGGTGGGGGGSVSGGGSGGGDSLVTWRDYVDAQDASTRAQNDARFAEVVAKLDAINVPTIWQIAGVAAVTLATAFAILAYASDRFDGGIAASGLIDRMQEVQAERDAAQDIKLDKILEAVRAQSQPSSEAPKAP